MTGQYQIIGKRYPRVDGLPKVTGQAKFAADFSLPGMLCGKVLRSPYPHARIVNIDVSKARQMPGVAAVITAADFKGFRYGFMPHTRDESPLAIEKVRFIGDEVAAVAATDLATAERAIELINVTYEQLPTVYDPEEALREGAPALHNHVKNNLSAHVKMDFGPVAELLARSHYVREDSFYSQSVLHGFLEPHACLALWEQENGITIWASKQSPYFAYRNLASCFNLPLSKVRVIQPFVGGGFGGKNETFALDYSAVMMSKITGRPVKIVAEMEEVLMAGRRRHPMKVWIRTGVDRNGLLQATDVRVIADGGAYTAVGPMTIYLAGAFVSLPYRLPAFRYEAWRAYTNKPVSVAQRGHGIPQVRYAAECQLDLIAAELGLDPMEIRWRNAVESGHVTANKMHVSSCGMKESLLKASGRAAWREAKQATKAKQEEGPILRGIGLACNGFCSGARLHGHTACSAVIKVHEDGTVSLLTGSTDSGQGSETVLAAITAELLGVPLEHVHVAKVDTQNTPVDPGSYGSRVTSTAGNAVRIAAEKVRAQLTEVAAQELQADAALIRFGNGEVWAEGDSNRRMPFRKLCHLAYVFQRGQVIIGHGFWGQDIDLPNWQTGEGDVAGTYTFGTQVAEVEVNKETGQIKVTKMIIAHDLGFALNPLSAEGQHEGSIFAGMGHALYEECQVEDGRTLNPSFLGYRMPTALDMPSDITSINIETHDAEGVFGAKESAEGTQVSTVPAIVNAIYDATGVMFTELPITPEKVLRALAAKERRGTNAANSI